MRKIPSILEQNKQNLKSLRLQATGKLTFRTYKIDSHDTEMAASGVRDIRENLLHVSQKVLADAVGVSVRTVQGWESGRSRPIGPARKLLQLVRRVPAARKSLLPV